MIEITKYRAGKCKSCEANTAEYAIKGEWDGPPNVCQPCMISFLQGNEKLRLVLALQAGATP